MTKGGKKKEASTLSKVKGSFCPTLIRQWPCRTVAAAWVARVAVQWKDCTGAPATLSFWIVLGSGSGLVGQGQRPEWRCSAKPATLSFWISLGSKYFNDIKTKKDQKTVESCCASELCKCYWFCQIISSKCVCCSGDFLNGNWTSQFLFPWSILLV